MLTPGLAGGLVMTITNALDVKFGCGDWLPYFVLAFSFLVGIVVFVDDKVQGWPKVALYLINSFVIFAMASGTNAIGTKVTEKKDEVVKEELKQTIPAIGFNSDEWEEGVFKYMTVQNVQQEDTLKIKKQMLKSQISNCSYSIQLIQKDIVENQKQYNDAAGKFRVLERINNDLVNVNNLVKTDTLLKREQAYQQELENIQHNLVTLQKALVTERKKPEEDRRFFKSWFN
jgi:hypothetical protein